MSVKRDSSGRRSIEVDVEVPGTPEEVWNAIATGPGITSWFVPTEIETRDGVPVKVIAHFGPGMDAVAAVTAWDPPRRFAAEGDSFGPNAPPLATEWIVEARSGGTCVVRVVHSLFTSSDEWDNQLESIESGWPRFFRLLAAYLKYFQGARCAPFRVMEMTSDAGAWGALIAALGLTDASAGTRWQSPAGVPPLAGVVEEVDERGDRHSLMMRVSEPAPGIVALFSHAAWGRTLMVVDFYLYGDRAPAIASRDEPAWRAWMSGVSESTQRAAADTPSLT